MARIEFKGKIHTMRYAGKEDEIAYEYIQIPELDRKHCDMQAFRLHQKYGAYANSDLFKGMLKRIRSDRLGNYKYLKLSEIPEGVTVDRNGFLAVVSFDV